MTTRSELPGSRTGRPRTPVFRRGASTMLSAAAAAARATRHAHEVCHPPASASRKGVRRTPADKGMPMRTARIITTRNRIPLDTWIVPAAGPHTVVVCHGMGRDRRSVLDHVAMLHRAGHNVVAYDMRNHGSSGRDRNVSGMAGRFTSDLADVLSHVTGNELGEGGELAVLAFSFSTWPALAVLRDTRLRDHLRRRGSRIAAVICDSGPIHDIASGLGHFALLRREALPERLQATVPFAVYRWSFSRVGKRMIAAKGWPPDLTGTSVRLMFVAGGQDSVVPADEVFRVADIYPRARRWTAPNALHMNAVRFDTEEYHRRVTGFLAESFADPLGNGGDSDRA